MAGVVAGCTVTILPFAGTRLGAWPAFMPVVVTTMTLAGIIPSFLLIQQYLVRGSGRMLALAGTLLGTAVLGAPQVLAPPAAAAAWLWAAWHVAFAGGILASSLPWPRAGEPAGPTGRRTAALAVVTGVPLMAAALVSFALAGAPGARPGTRELPVVAVVLGAAALASSAWRGRRGEAVQRWLPLAALAVLLDAILVLVAPAPFTLGWYSGSLLSGLAAAVVLAVLLHQVTELYRRLWDAHVRLLEESRHDFLTALLTRREGLRQLAQVLQQAERHEFQLAVGVLDIDHFKSFNDTHGHAVGDRVLEEVAARVRGSLRAGDFAFRLGGEEFGIAFTHATEEEALEAGWRILRVVRSRPVRTDEGPVTVTASIGVAAAMAGEPVQDAVDRADQALYEAKRSGRDRVRGHSRMVILDTQA